MEDRILKDLLGTYKNFVFIGESGSGKTELGINLAMELAKRCPEVHFFDLDQTKPLFRARDAAGFMEAGGVRVHSQKQFQDIPSMVPGIAESFMDQRQYTLLDVGGNEHGAFMAGQLERYINTEDTCVFFIINVYRPWSKDARHIVETKNRILKACRIARVRLISNPNLGPTTTAREVVEGNRRLKRLLGEDTSVDYVCVPENLSLQAAELGQDIIPIHPYIHMPDGMEREKL